MMKYRDFVIARFGKFPPVVDGETIQTAVERMFQLNADYMDYLASESRKEIKREIPMQSYDSTMGGHGFVVRS